MTAASTAPGQDGVAPADPLRRATGAIGLATAGSGLGLVLAPRLTLKVLGAKAPEPAPFLFRIVGMFMFVSGGSLTDASRNEVPPAAAMRWALVAKIGAALFVTAGVRTHRFGRQALAIAAVDAGSAVAVGALLSRRR